MATKRKTLCIDEKVSLIRAIDQGERKSDVAKRFGFSISTVCTIWKNKEKFLQAKMEGKSSKRLKKPTFEALDLAMFSWFCEQRESNISVTGPIIKAKAEKLAKKLGITNFKASTGWLGKFKQRHRINYVEPLVPPDVKATTWDICLICLNKTISHSQFPLNHDVGNKNQTILNLLQEFNFFDDSFSNDSSNIICRGCLNQLKSSYEFKLQCQRAKDYWTNPPPKSNLSSENQSQPETSASTPSTSVYEFESTSEKRIKLEPEIEDVPDIESIQYSENTNEVKIEFEEINIKEELCEEFIENSKSETVTITQESPEINESVQSSKRTSTTIICCLCNSSFPQRKNFWRHIEKWHFTNRCIDIIPTKQYYNNTPLKKLTFYCGLCNSCFYEMDIFISHLAAIHPTNNLSKCSFCSEEFSNLIDFVTHAIIHYS